MADLTFTPDDLGALGAKLDGVVELDERDRSLLLAVFRLAGDQAASLAECAETAEVAGFAAGPLVQTSVPAGTTLASGFGSSFSAGPTAAIGGGVKNVLVGMAMPNRPGNPAVWID
jgi:hypothetical protein